MTFPFDMILRILQVVVGFTLLLLFHEIGHLIFGVLVGVKVERLSIGFGPKLFGFTRRGTEYVISAVPAGGYVKFKGDEPGSPESRDPDSFWGKSPGPRALIIIGGVLMNLITGAIAFAIAFGVGVKMESPMVGQVLPHSPAEMAGFMSGDRVLTIDGRKVTDFQDISYGVALGDRSEPLVVEVERGGQSAVLHVTPEFDKERGIRTMGIIPPFSLTVGELIKGSTAREAGLLVGDEIVSVNGAQVGSWEEFDDIYTNAPGETLTLTVNRHRDLVELSVPVEAIYTWTLGVEGFPEVERVLPGWPADEAGLRQGDILLAFNNTEIVANMLPQLLQENQGAPAILTVLRDFDRLRLTVTARHEEDKRLLGITYLPSLLIARVHEGSPAAEAGIASGDRITSVAGNRVSTMSEVQLVLQDLKGSPFDIQWVRQREVMSSQISAEKTDAPPVGFLGILPEAQTEVIRRGLFGACRLGVLKTLSTVGWAVETVKGLLTRQVSATNVGGPVFISYVLYRRAAQGFSRLIYFFGMISVLIALPNMLPLPVLDGGHLVILLIEKLKGSPVSTRAMMVWQYAGIVLIGAIFILVLANDINRLFNLPF